MSEDSDTEDITNKPSNKRDEVIRKQSFSRARGLDISSFMIEQEEEKPSVWEDGVEESETDVAMGEIAEIFSKGGEDFNRLGAVQKDGTVNSAPEIDSVTFSSSWREAAWFWSVNCYDLFLVNNRDYCRDSTKSSAWGYWPDNYGHNWPISWRKMDP